ncbi:MAG TPA: 3-deoxy-7-phosphoheptulonate synthase, partial [Bacteroidota bacterium]|nr:3-deoxy-7-phosphoheptulonate synthase [Bacteroidota bacterium]
MLILMKSEATKEDILRVCQKIETMGYRAHEIPGAQRTAIGITGNQGKIDPETFATMSGVEQAIPVTKPYKLAGRDARRENSEVSVGGEIVGGRELAIIAGPCSVESWDQLITTARAVKDAGAKFLRGGAFK